MYFDTSVEASINFGSVGGGPDLSTQNSIARERSEDIQAYSILASVYIGQWRYFVQTYRSLLRTRGHASDSPRPARCYRSRWSLDLRAGYDGDVAAAATLAKRSCGKARGATRLHNRGGCSGQGWRMRRGVLKGSLRTSDERLLLHHPGDLALGRNSDPGRRFIYTIAIQHP